MITLDFETHPIGPGLDQFPKPVGLAVRHTNGKSQYLAWGHPTGNNCTEAQAKSVWDKAWRESAPVFHNAKFDIGVAVRHWGFEIPSGHRYHDTMFLVFLKNNIAKSFGLKPSAEEYLNLPPEEQDELTELARSMGLIAWNSNKSGAVIAQLPAEPVGRYAIGDVDRTWGLFDLLYNEIKGTAAEVAYDRERNLMPILLRRELEGIAIHEAHFREDVATYSNLRDTYKATIHRKLGNDSVNLNSGAELFSAITAAGLFDESKAVRTPTGKVSTAKANLAAGVSDVELVGLLDKVSTLNTYLDTFMLPWLSEADTNGGRVCPSFSQVRQMGDDGKGSKGTKTGRLSAPRFLNTPKKAEEGMPNVRSYLAPEDGHIWVKRDYSQQEYRVLAHYIEGRFAQIYLDNPKADIHTAVAELCNITRRHAKTVGFGLLYGLGLPGLAELLGTNSAETSRILRAYQALMPELDQLKDGLKARYRKRLPIRSLGGRSIQADPPGYSKKYKRMMTYDYKLLNYLIQGGSADVTKEAIILFDAEVLSKYDPQDVKFLITVHDEINLSARQDLQNEVMRGLYSSMLAVKDSLGLDIVMESDGNVGPSWGELISYEF